MRALFAPLAGLRLGPRDATLSAMASYTHEKVLEGVGYDDAVEKVTAALKTEGFGVLTTIDVKATLKKKIDVDFRRYVILGACNPTMAHKALSAELDIGALLPCNVVVYEADDGTTVVSAVNPIEMFKVVDRPDMHAIAEDVDSRIRRVLEAL